MLELDVYNDQDKLSFKNRFVEHYKEYYAKVVRCKTEEFRERNIESDLYKEGWNEGCKNKEEYTLTTPNVLSIQYYYGLIDGAEAHIKQHVKK